MKLSSLKHRFHKMYTKKHTFAHDKKKSRRTLLFEIGYKFSGYEPNTWNWIEKDSRTQKTPKTKLITVKSWFVLQSRAVVGRRTRCTVEPYWTDRENRRVSLPPSAGSAVERVPGGGGTTNRRPGNESKAMLLFS